MFALPDLYNTSGNDSKGIGAWGLMGNGSWNKTVIQGDSPAHMTGWSKAWLLKLMHIFIGQLSKI